MLHFKVFKMKMLMSAAAYPTTCCTIWLSTENWIFFLFEITCEGWFDWCVEVTLLNKSNWLNGSQFKFSSYFCSTEFPIELHWLL